MNILDNFILVCLIKIYMSRFIYFKRLFRQGISYFKFLYQFRNHFTSIKKREIVVCINRVINADNINSLKDIVKIGNNLGVDIIKFEHLHYMSKNDINSLERDTLERFSENKLKFSYSMGQDGLLDGNLVNSKTNKLISNSKIPLIIKPNLLKEEIFSWYDNNHNIVKKCPYIYRFMHVDASGEVYLCQYIRESLGNIKNLTLKEIWNSEKYKDMRSLINNKLSPICYRCCKI